MSLCADELIIVSLIQLWKAFNTEPDSGNSIIIYPFLLNIKSNNYFLENNLLYMLKLQYNNFFTYVKITKFRI